MIVRIVKLTFKEDEIDSFLEVFKKQKEFIGGFDGCSGVELLRDKNQQNVFFTYSHWDNEEALERYRASDFFRNIWSGVKKKFSDKPLAWSLEKYG